MSQRLVNPSKQWGISKQGLRCWALLFLTAGVVGYTILEKMKGNYGTEFVMDTIGAVLELIQACAVPLFCYMLVDGIQHTKSYLKYFLRVLGLALVCEIPFDLVYSGKVFFWGSQNPLLGFVVAMIMLYLVRSYAGKGIKTVLVNVLAFVMAILWVKFMQVKEGLPIIFLVTTFWYCRNRKAFQIFGGAVVTCLCSLVVLDGSLANLHYLMAPLSVVLIYFYNGEQGEENKLINYGAFPFIMMACWLIARFAV